MTDTPTPCGDCQGKRRCSSCPQRHSLEIEIGRLRNENDALRQKLDAMEDSQFMKREFVEPCGCGMSICPECRPENFAERRSSTSEHTGEAKDSPNDETHQEHT